MTSGYKMQIIKQSIKILKAIMTEMSIKMMGAINTVTCLVFEEWFSSQADYTS